MRFLSPCSLTPLTLLLQEQHSSTNQSLPGLGRFPCWSTNHRAPTRREPGCPAPSPCTDTRSHLRSSPTHTPPFGWRGTPLPTCSGGYLLHSGRSSPDLQHQPRLSLELSSFRSSFQTPPSAAVNRHRLQHPSFYCFLFGPLPPRSKHTGEGKAQSGYIPALRAIFWVIIITTPNLCALGLHASMPDFWCPWLERGLQHNSRLLPNNRIAL